MTKREGAIITAFTGILVGDFKTFHAYIEEIMHRPIMIHEMANEHTVQLIKGASTKDFIELCKNVTD